MRKSLLSDFNATKLPFLRKLLPALPKDAEVFIVGGAVRDVILRRPTKDIDLVVRKVSINTLERILRRQGPVELVGKTFGVFKWMPRQWKGEAVDVALPRRDHAFGTGGYKHVKIQSDPNLPLKDDMQRRDYTVNAIAFDVRKKALVDDVGGISDISAKLLRTVGEPAVRFHEDFSRMLRGLRLSVTLGFNLEGHTVKTMRLMMHHLIDTDAKGQWIVPRETIGRELVRMFASNPAQAFEACFYGQVFAHLIPEVMDMQSCQQPKEFHVEGDVMQHTHRALEAMHSPSFKKLFGSKQPSALLAFAALLHDIGKPLTITFPLQGTKDRIRYNNHDVIGSQMARHIVERLALSVFPKEDTAHHVDADALAWIVRHHLVGFRNSIKAMRPGTIEKYYFHPVHPSEALLQLQCIDSLATVPRSGKPDMSGFSSIWKTVQRIKKARKGSSAKPILTGFEVMRVLKIPSGKQVGAVLEELRNAQLSGRIKTKKQAEAFAKHIPLR